MSLMEMVVIVAVISTCCGLAIPPALSLIERNQAALAMNWIVRSVQFTRTAAVTQGKLTTLCPSRNGTSCGGKWHDGVLVFTDANGNRQMDAGDARLLRLIYPYPGSTIKWRSFGNRQYLQIRPSGFTNFQNGNFVYCNADMNPRYARQVVISLPGRVRKSYDSDDDGVVEDRYGKVLRC